MSANYGYSEERYQRRHGQNAGNQRRNGRKKPNSKKASFRKKEQNKASMFLVTFAAVVIISVIFVSGLGLQKKIDAYNERIDELTAEIQKEEARKEKIEEYRKYTQTKGFVEEIAQDQLGLVYEGEIIFKQD